MFCDDVWFMIAMNGPILKKLELVIKNFDVRAVACTKIQRFWRKFHVSGEICNNDRVFLIYKSLGLKTVAFIKFIDPKTNVMCINFVSEKKIKWVFYQKNNDNIYVRKLL
tara:strand:+ start:3229 stop:3558 length:330 start_codon:yes stop_codon:yes gene_type:complete